MTMNFLKRLMRSKVNRPLTMQERECHLPQNEPSLIPLAWPQWSVIRMNSTFLECVDFWFARKGMATTAGLAAFPFVVFSLFFFITIIAELPEQMEHNFAEELILAGTVFLGTSLMAVFVLGFLLFEVFGYTHHPMRFNRKTRMVHVFMDWEDPNWHKGKIISIPWDKIHFNYSRDISKECIVHGHYLADDGETVLATFTLPNRDAADSPHRFVQWEFVRQYMEGDERKLGELASMVTAAMDVSDRRETPMESFRRTWAIFSGGYVSFMIISLPLAILFTPGRIVAMLTGRIPRWPAEIEATCQIDPNDPHLRDGQHLAPRETAPLPDVTPYVGR